MSENEIAGLGVVVTNTGVDQTTTSLQKLAAAGAQAETATKNLGAAGPALSGALKDTAAAADTVTSAHGKMSASALQVRESLVLVREALNGNTTRMVGSASILAGSFGLMTTAILGTVGAVVAFAAPLALLGVAFVQGQQQIAAFNNALLETNGYSGLTAGAFEDMAARIAASSDTGIGKIKSDITSLAASGKFTSDTIDQIVQYSAKMAELTGQDSSKIVASFDAMKGSVVDFAVAHEEQYHDLTLAQIDYIAQLQKEGDYHAAELQFATDINAKIQGVTVQYGSLQVALHDTAKFASDFWDALLGVGRPKTIEQQLADAQGLLNEMRQGGNVTSTPYGLAAAPNASGAQIAQQQGVVAGLQAQKAAQDQAAAAAAKTAQDQDDAIRKKYGKTGGADKTDQTAQQTSSVDAAVAQSKQAELQAQLALTTDITQRATIEQQIAAASDAEKTAQTQRQIAQLATLAAEGHISEATAAQLTSKLQGAEALDKQTAALKSQLASEQASDALAKQTLDISDARLDAQSTILGLQKTLATNADAQYQIDTQILQLAGQKAQDDAQAVIDSKLANANQKAQAAIVIANLPTEQALKQEALDRQQLAASISQQASMAQDMLTNQAAYLTSQKGVADFAFQQEALDKQILASTQANAVSKVEEALAAAQATDDQTAISKAMSDLASLLQTQANDTVASNGTLFGNYDKVNTGLANVSTALSSHDWGSATNSFINALGNAATILNSTSATIGQKIGSITGVISGVGNLIGGQAGADISGIGSGAAAGAQIGSIIPGVGTVVGAVLGGIGGLLSNVFGNAADAAQKLATAQTNLTAAQNAAQTAIQAATTAANNQNQAEEALLTASGQAQAELNLERQIELASVDATTQAIDKQLYAWQDYNTALATATTTLTDAQSNLNTVYAAAVSTLQSTASTFQTFITNLEAFKTTLSTGDLAQNSPSLQYALTKSAFQSTASAASTGDQTALGNIEDAGSAFLTASAATAKSLVAYETDLASVKSATDTAELAAQNQISLAQQQLETMNAMVGGIIAVANIVSSVSSSTGSTANSTAAIDAAMANLITAVQQVNTAQTAVNAVVATQPATPVAPAAPVSATPGYTSTNGDFALYVQENPDLLKEWLTDWAPNHKGWTEAEYGAYQWNTFGINEGRAIRPYAKGGAFTNGIVSNPTAFDIGVMGEAGPEAVMPLARGADGSLGVRASNDNSAMLAELQALRAEVTAMRNSQDRVFTQSKKTADLLYRCTRDGSSLVTTAG